MFEGEFRVEITDQGLRLTSVDLIEDNDEWFVSEIDQIGFELFIQRKKILDGTPIIGCAHINYVDEDPASFDMF